MASFQKFSFAITLRQKSKGVKRMQRRTASLSEDPGETGETRRSRRNRGSRRTRITRKNQEKPGGTMRNQEKP